MNAGLHANKTYQKSWQELHGNLAKMLDLVLKLLDICSRNLSSPSHDLTTEARTTDQEINAINFRIDDLITEMVAKHSVFAAELRFIISAIKISTYIERMGDLAKSSVKRINKIGAAMPLRFVDPIKQIIELNRELINPLKDMLDTVNEEKAQKIWESDDWLDEAYASTFREVQAEIARKPDDVKQLTHLLLICRNLERMGDYSASIAKILYYVKSGTVVTKEMARLLAKKDDIVSDVR